MDFYGFLDEVEPISPPPPPKSPKIKSSCFSGPPRDSN